MLTLGISLLLALLQTTQTGTVVGIVKFPDSPRPVESAHIVLLPAKYTELWNKQMQMRLDNVGSPGTELEFAL